MKNRFLRLLDEKKTLLVDGATGTNLFALGLQSGDSPEFWNIDFPDRVAQHYRSFIDAGSDIVLTNTFGGNSYRLKLHGAQDRVAEFNSAAARILVAEIASSGRDVVVAGSMGPTGEIFAPAGPMTIEDGEIAFAEQAMALKEGGADILWIETLSSIAECHAAVRGAAVAGLPVVLTLSIETNGRTMMGVTPSDFVNLQKDLATPLVAYGTNCGLGAGEVIAAIINMQQAAAIAGVKPILVAKGNCGIPEWKEGEICYSGTPDLMARYATMAMDAGARIIGGCCGTTPQHIAVMREAIDKHVPGEAPTLTQIESLLGTITSGAKAQMGGDLSIAGGAAGPGKKASSRSRRNASTGQ
jgi:methionine synthase I (cobalamin-dependent)